MTILDELERLHKKAVSVYYFHNSSIEDVDWLRFIERCQKHLPALIEAARCLEHVVEFGHFTPGGSTHKWATDILEKLK